jgi:hypothetical protein
MYFSSRKTKIFYSEMLIDFLAFYVLKDIENLNGEVQSITDTMAELLKISQPVFTDLKSESKKLKMDLESLMNENDMKKKELNVLNSQYEQKKQELNEKSDCYSILKALNI